MPANYVQFAQIEALFAATNGDVFVQDNYKFMRRFDASGKFIANYDIESRDNWPSDLNNGSPTASAIAARDGSVYSHSLGILEKRRLVSLILNASSRPGQRLKRIIDLRNLESIGSGDILLMGSDANNNLYFQYRYPLKDDEWVKDWMGPMAIAKVGSDDKAVKIFDIYEHYKNKVTSVGDLLHVSPQGDLYLEMQTATHYRIDKISIQ